MIRSIYQCNFQANRSSGSGGVVLHTYTRKLVYAALSMRDAQYQTTCLRQVLVTTCLRQVLITLMHCQCHSDKVKSSSCSCVDTAAAGLGAQAPKAGQSSQILLNISGLSKSIIDITMRGDLSRRESIKIVFGRSSAADTAKGAHDAPRTLVFKETETLRSKIDRKPATSLQRCQFYPKFHVEGVARHQSFLHGNFDRAA